MAERGIFLLNQTLLTEVKMSNNPTFTESRTHYAIVESSAGNFYIGEVHEGIPCFDGSSFAAAVADNRSVKLFKVFKVISLNIPISPGNVARITKLCKLDFCEGPLEVLELRVASFYYIGDDVFEKYIKPEIDDLLEKNKEGPSLVRPVVGIPPLGFDPCGKR